MVSNTAPRLAAGAFGYVKCRSVTKAPAFETQDIVTIRWISKTGTMDLADEGG